MEPYAKLFPYLQNQEDIIYFDNAATSLKPEVVINAEANYNRFFAANPHTQDYKQAFEATQMITQLRERLSEFLNAPKNSSFILTSGATHSLNQVAFGLQSFINPGDEILTTSLEHSAALLPFIEVANRQKAKIKLLTENDHGKIVIKELLTKITDRTKIIVYASSTNVIGALNDVALINKAIRKVNKEIIIVVDAAQSIGHHKTDLSDWDADFIAFSGHKIFAPFGTGILWGKKPQLEKLTPLFFGGAMSDSVDLEGIGFKMKPLPERLEGGTPNISAIYGFLKAIEFVQSIGIANIAKYEKKLKNYAIIKAKNIPSDLATFYNLENDGPILTFNIRNYNPQDIATFLWVKYKIQVRSGSHCARIVQNQNIAPTSVRASFAFFNTTAEIDKLFEAILNSDNFLEAIV
ncbi:cysteine desulfurase [Spiroplasma sabaudiense Ar-1343]|uniref:Cysteine desulfurase n=1 Tax=Spiroplasma sabaudiense Ar-1343 TaxID=1276257 RepID=W6AA23_9MOLU|nr:aminotransferase class V-fold PLP-dependent enzyme [Spiroplasma sabaudiense]AHI54033.1 cysteine desulfurase [Spiroplasma sabaudiense Ar-1343]